MNIWLKMPSLAHASLAQLVRHCIFKPVIISCIRSSATGGYFFAVVKSSDANTAISANYVKNHENLNITADSFNYKLYGINILDLTEAVSWNCSYAKFLWLYQ